MARDPWIHCPARYDVLMLAPGPGGAVQVGANAIPQLHEWRQRLGVLDMQQEGSLPLAGTDRFMLGPAGDKCIRCRSYITEEDELTYSDSEFNPEEENKPKPRIIRPV